MKKVDAPETQTARRVMLIACVAALAAVFTVALSPAAHADQVTPPPVPLDILAPAGTKAFLVGHAVGTQDYICLPSGWAPFGATLFNDDAKQIITHFLSRNPDEENKPFATWQHSQDTSAVGDDPTVFDPEFVAPDAIPWFLLEVVGAQAGPTGGQKLTKTTHIQRLNTTGGKAPSSACGQGEIGNKELVEYTADYFFYKNRHDGG